MNHEEIAELLGAWALDAVDSEEAAMVAAHLEVCPRCAQEVDGYREAAAALAFVGTTAPGGLWERIEARLEEEPPPALDMARITRLPSATSDGGRVAGRTGTGRRRSGVVRIGPWSVTGVRAAAATALAVAAVGIALLGLQVQHLHTQVGHLASRSQFALPDGAVRVNLRSPDRSTLVPAVLSADGDGFVEVGNLPVLPPGQTYQLWAVTGGRRISIGVLGNTFDVSTFKAQGTIDLLAITAEDAPGVEQSDKPPVVVADVPHNKA